MIECTSFLDTPNNFLVGVAEVRICNWGYKLRDVKLWKKDDRYWVTTPSKCIEFNGKKTFVAFGELEDPVKQKAFLQAILEAIHKYRNSFNNEIPEF